MTAFLIVKNLNISCTFPTARPLHNYYEHVKKQNVIDDGWGRVITLTHYPTNHTECFTCPLLMPRHLIWASGGPGALLRLTTCYNAAGERIFGTPWDAAIYDRYIDTVRNGQLLLFDFYLDGASLSKSGTYGTTFILVQLSNLRPYT